MALTPGARLDSYEILGLLGAGGMGEVYRARDVVLKREVAIKVLPAYVSRDPDRLRRFEQEAQAAAALNHPNILAIHQFGTFEGAPYLVSELLDGCTLRQLMERGPIPVRKTTEYGVQIAHGLAAAHERNIVHRDLKPENLFIVKDGRVKILDFGLAKLIQPQLIVNGDGPTKAHETEPGTVMGTVSYMSPEQVRGNAVDHRADIFAFGAILYEMLTGSRAFQRRTPAESMTAILNDEPPAISQSGQNISPGLQRVIHRCLEKSPEQRFQSAADLAFAIESLTDASGATVSESGVGIDSRKSSPAKWVIASALILTVLVGGFLLRYFHVASRGPERASLDIRALTESGKVRRVAASPDGRYLAYVQSDPGKSELRLLQVATQRNVQVLPGSPLEIVNLHFSPDGSFIYYLRRLNSTDSLGVFRIAALGGPATTLASDARSRSLTVSPDGKQIAYISQTSTESQIVAIDPDGSNRRVIARRPLARDFWFIEWSPLADALAAVAIGDEDMGLVRIDLQNGSIQELSTSGWGAVGQPAWSPDGATIFAPAIPSGGTTFQIWAFDPRTGAHRPITSGAKDYGEFTLSSTAGGDLVGITGNPATTLWATDPSSHLHQIPSLPGEGFDSLIWVDGRIVTGNVNELQVHDPDGTNPTRLKAYSNIYRQLARCGAGRLVYWASDDTHGSHIARTDILTGSTTRLTDGPTDGYPTCTADGSTLVFEHCTDKGSRCAVTRKSLDSGQSASLYDERADENSVPFLSPDGNKVLIAKSDAEDTHKWLAWVPLTGGSPQMLTMPVTAAEVTQYRWAPDGKSILYSRAENGVGNIWSAPLDGKAPRKLTSFLDSDNIFAFDVSPDNRLALCRGSWVSDAVLIKNAK
jgi:serine/threonine protein kinase